MTELTPEDTEIKITKSIAFPIIPIEGGLMRTRRPASTDAMWIADGELTELLTGATPFARYRANRLHSPKHF